MARGQSVYQGQYSFPVRSTVEQSLARSAQAQAQMYGSLGESIGKVANAYFEKKNEKDQIKALAKREDIRAMVFRGQPMPTDEKEIEKAVAATYKGLGGTLGVENMLFRQQAEQRAQAAEQRQVETFERLERKERAISDYFKAIGAKRGGTPDVSLEERQARGTLGEAARRLGGDLLNPEAWKEASGRLGHPLSERSAKIARLSPDTYMSDLSKLQKEPLAQPAAMPPPTAPAAQSGLFLRDVNDVIISPTDVENTSNQMKIIPGLRDKISKVFDSHPEFESILEDSYLEGTGIFKGVVPSKHDRFFQDLAALRETLGRTPLWSEVERMMPKLGHQIPDSVREFYQSDAANEIFGDQTAEIIERPIAAPAAQPTYLGGMIEQAGEAMGRLGDVQLPERVTRRTIEGEPGRSLLERRQGMTQPSYLEAFMLENPNATPEMMEIALKDAASLPARAPQEPVIVNQGRFSWLQDPVTKQPISGTFTTTAGAKPTFKELAEIEETGIKLQDATNDMGRMFKIFKMDAQGRPTGEVDKWLVGPDIANKTSRWLQDKGFTQWQSDELIDNRDFLEQFVNENVISESARLSGSISEGELKILRNTAPTLNSSPKVWREYLNKINATLQRETQLNNRLRGVLGGGGYGGGLGAAGGEPQVNPMQAKTSAQVMDRITGALADNSAPENIRGLYDAIPGMGLDPAVAAQVQQQMRNQYPNELQGVTATPTGGSAPRDPSHDGLVQKIEGFDNFLSGPSKGGAEGYFKSAMGAAAGGAITGGPIGAAVGATVGGLQSGDAGERRAGHAANTIPTAKAIKEVDLEGKEDFIRLLTGTMQEALGENLRVGKGGFAKTHVERWKKHGKLKLDDFKGDKKAWYGKYPDPLHPHNFNLLIDYAMWSLNQMGPAAAARGQGHFPNPMQPSIKDYLLDFTEQLQATTGDPLFGKGLVPQDAPRMKQALNPKRK